MSSWSSESDADGNTVLQIYPPDSDVWLFVKRYKQWKDMINVHLKLFADHEAKRHEDEHIELNVAGRPLEVLREFLWGESPIYAVQRNGGLVKLFADGDEAKLWLDCLQRDVPAEGSEQWHISIERLRFDAFAADDSDETEAKAP